MGDGVDDEGGRGGDGEADPRDLRDTLPALAAGSDPSQAPSPPSPLRPLVTDTPTLAYSTPGAPAPTLVPASAPAPAAVPCPAVIAGRYEVLQELGRGAMGVVYRTRDRQLGREVALKLLLLGDRSQPDDIERFHREVRAAAGLQHSGIIQVHDVGAAEGNKPFYTMELVDGRELSSAIRDQAVSPREAVEITRQLAEAVQFAHARGVLHRDIKPRNIILRRETEVPGGIAAAPAAAGTGPAPAPDRGRPVVKLLDFGLAKFAEREVQMPQARDEARSLRTLTREGVLVGTPAYMSPEQVNASTSVDARTDVYCLGATLYEMITGHPPFHDAATLVDLLQRIFLMDPIPPRRLVPDLDADLETICLKCLQKEPKDRYARAADLAEDCRRWLAGEPIAARPAGTLVRLWKRARRNRAVALPVAALALVAVGAGIWLPTAAVLRAVRVAALRREVVAALASRDLPRAEQAAGSLLQAADDRSAKDLYDRVKAAVAVSDGDAAFDAYAQARTELERLARKVEAGRKQAAAATTHAAKADLWRQERRVHDLEAARGNALAAAVSAYGKAVGYLKEQDATEEARRARERLGDLYWDRYLEAERARNVADEQTAARLVAAFAPQKYGALLRGERAVRVAFLLPEGYAAAAVEVFLFRYERTETPPVLVPVPCRPATGEALAAPALSAAEPVPLAVARDPAASAVRTVRHGSVFRLCESPENRLSLPVRRDPGSPRPRVHFECRLPKGSYLLHVPAGQEVFETRYPFVVARDLDWDERCELVAADAAPPLPPGAEATPASPYWAYVAAGPYRASGDRDAHQAPPRDAALVRVPDGLFLGRFEVTSSMYLVYLSDRSWHGAADVLKRAPRRAADGNPESTYWPLDAAGGFQMQERAPAWRGDWPIGAVSGADVVDYCRWLTARHGGGEWEFGLPTEDEWEKAARGPDGRFFPWGDVPDPTFCRTMDSRTAEQETPQPEPIGLFPLDEGPYGVRDQGGGVQEWTATPFGARGEYRVIKGGSWNAGSAWSRSSYRNIFEPFLVNILNGFRLAARRAR